MPWQISAICGFDFGDVTNRDQIVIACYNLHILHQLRLHIDTTYVK